MLGNMFLSFFLSMNISRKHLRSTRNLVTAAVEAKCYGNLRTVLSSLGEYVKAKEYLRKALAIKGNWLQSGRRRMLWKHSSFLSR